MSPTATPVPCSCGLPTHHAIHPTVEFEVTAACLRLDGVGVLRCEAGHTTVADPDLATHVQTAIDDRLLVARTRRLRRDSVCGNCGASLTMPGRRTDTPVPFATTFGVVTPTVVATMIRCPECGREQLDPDTRAAIAPLLAAALDQMSSAP